MDRFFSPPSYPWTIATRLFFLLVEACGSRPLHNMSLSQRAREWVRIAVSKGVQLAADQVKNQLS